MGSVAPWPGDRNVRIMYKWNLLCNDFNKSILCLIKEIISDVLVLSDASIFSYLKNNTWKTLDSF